MSKENLVVSFSGGETSAFMARWLIDNKCNKFNMIFVFANTGDEEEKTLEFINKCSTEWNLNIVWIETVVHHNERKGSTHKVVDFETASRNREPFEEIIKKYGIPNQNFPHCNRELKLAPINSYVKSLGWKNYKTAIGIRSDEFDRVNGNYKKLKLYYPLVSEYPTTKQFISKWWSKQNFRVELKSYQTNCRTCWKKSKSVLYTIYKENPEYFNWNTEMEQKYGKDKYTFFREGTSALQLIEDSKYFNGKVRDLHQELEYQIDMFNNDSCDVYSLCGNE
jgi:hypothetical protein